MIKYGFFNSVNGDRVYNAESFNDFFEGLISSNGVFEGVRGSFIVSAGTGLNISVATGKAIVNNHWVVNDAIEIVALDTAHGVLNRWDMIGLIWNSTDRTVTLRKTTGTPASTPVKPSPVRTTTEHEIVLAYVYVGAGVTSVTNADITDTRYDDELCGLITGLIEQVDTGTLYRRFATELAELRAEFDIWFNALTEELNVNTYITSQSISYTGDGTVTQFAMPSEYEAGDIVDVYLNNIVLMPDIDYTISGNTMIKTTELRVNNTLTIRILKSKIGFNTTA